MEKEGREVTYLRTDKITQSLLRRSNSLVPGTLRAIGIVLGDSTGGGSRVVANLGCCVGSVVLEFTLGLFGLSSVLSSTVSF
jgi:hypothetical protein